MVRPPGERWAIRVRAADANAWLALRLPQWLEHDRELSWPKDVNLAQVQFDAPDRLTLGVERKRLIWSATVRVVLTEGRLTLEPVGAGVGRLWVPWSVAFAFDDSAIGVSAFVPELAHPVEAIMPLHDGRRVKLVDFEFDDGEARFRFETLAR